MRINFFILNLYGLGGTVRTVVNTANYLAEQGYDVRIVSIYKHLAKPHFELHPKIKIKVLMSVSKSRPKRIIKRILRNQKSVLVHKQETGYKSFNMYTDICAYKFLKSLNNEILITTRAGLNILAAKYTNESVIKIGQEHLNFEVHQEDLKELIRNNYKKLDYVATLTDKDTEDYAEILKNSNTKVVKLTNAIPTSDGRISFLENKTIIAAGRLSSEKGFDTLINSFDLIKYKYPDWKLKIYGKGKYKGQLQNLIKEKHLYNQVLLMGPTNQITEKFLESSIFVLSSKYEGFGMVIVEAMQCGLPVVSFDCPRGPREIIKHEHDGILVENQNIEELAKALSKLIDNYEERQRLGANAYESVKRYSIDTIGQEWIKLIEEINNNEE